MSNVVQFLETLACATSPLSAEDFATAVGTADLPAEMKQALLARDIEALSAALGGRARMLCMVVPAENDEPVEDDRDDGGDEGPGSDTAARAA